MFLLTLFVAGPLMVAVDSFGSPPLSLTSALLIIVLLAVVAGIIGLWTDKIPF
ncbi:MAG: hypothetical protein ACK4K7_14095 [Allosphingosinicella sp.]|uniref:hypothetical protein n=1 Tax=Allosphingosinicella sp. TaxID=2823234 RepID=UPI0039623E4F